MEESAFNMKSESEYRHDIIEVCRRIYQKGYVASNDGNVTVRMSEDEILATPTGMSKGDISSDQLIKVDMDGKVIAGFHQPSSELKLHIRAYEKRTDVRSVVHAHPPISTGFAVAGIALEQMAIPEVITTLGRIPLAPYGTPSTEELAHTIDEYICSCNAILLANHGALTVGPDVFSAYYTMERVEHSAHIIWVAKSLGGERPLSKESISKLAEIRKKMMSGNNARCATCPLLQAEMDKEHNRADEQELIDLIARVTADVIRETGGMRVLKNGVMEVKMD